MCEEQEIPKPSFEEMRIQADIYAKQRELDLREKELEHKIVCDTQSRRILFTPLTTAIIAGLLSLAAGVFTAFIGGFWSLKAQQEKNQGELELKQQERQFQMVIKATEDRTTEEAAQNLLFFVDIGYLPDPENKIRNKAETKQTPVINSSPVSSANPLLDRYSKVMADKEGDLNKIGTPAYSVAEHLLINSNGKPVSPIPANSLKPGLSPRVLIFHFTATGSAESIANFMATQESNASAHILIDRDGLVTQMVPFDYVAHHVGGSSYKNYKPLNNYSIGIELVNWGQLTLNNDKWVSYSGVTIPTSEVQIDNKSGVGWHKYTEKQIQAAIDVASAIVLAYPTIEDIIGHETVSSGKKNDPGPAFPIEKVRKIAMTKRQ